MHMRKFLQNKLWRDKMPHIKRAAGSIVHYKHLDEVQYDYQLRMKLIEEVKEIEVASSKVELIEELADVFEVIHALCALHTISLEDIHLMQTKKHDEKGGFDNRIFVTSAEHPTGSDGELYCLAQPNKYPEIL